MQVGVGVELSNVLGKVPPVPSIHVIQTACNLLSTRLPWKHYEEQPCLHSLLQTAMESLSSV